MITCWAIGRKLVRLAHRAIHRAVHKVRHHYHSPVVKIVAPAIVCVSTGAGLAPWLTSAPPIAAGPGLPVVTPGPAAVPVVGGMFAGPSAGLSGIGTLSAPELTEFPAELTTLNFNELIPSSYEFVPGGETSITPPLTPPSPVA